MIIPKNTFLEMNEDVEVMVLYPNSQVDLFYYKDPFKFSTMEYDSIGFLISTTYNGNLFYQHYSSQAYHREDDSKIIKGMKEDIKTAVLKTV